MKQKRKKSPAKRIFKFIVFLIVAALVIVIGRYAYIGGKLYLTYKGYTSPETPSKNDYPVRGVDVSKWQGNISWSSIAKEGFSFAFIKASEGVDYEDKIFSQNWEQIEDSPMYAGAYHYFSFGSDGKAQAENYIKVVGKNKNTLPPVVDFELTDEDTSVPKSEIKKELDDLLDTLEDYYGQKPIIYTTITAYWKYLYLGYSKYPLWMRNTYTEPTQKWTFWQYSDKGHLDGCYDGDQQYIDLNVYNGSIEDFRKEFSLEVKG